MTRRGRGRPPYPDILTPAEWRILEEVRTGATNAEIAVRLGLSPFTVKYHVSNILGKLQLQNRRQIATWQPTPARVGFPQMVAARARALVGPFLAPFAFLPKPAIGVAVAAVVAMAAIPAIVVAVLLTRPEEPVNLVLSPDPSPSPVVGATSTPTPTPEPTPEATPEASPTPEPTPEATPDPTPEPTPDPTPEPTPEPPVDATPNALGIREIATDEAFIRLEYAAGEQIAETTGLFFLDVETGAVEGWQHAGGLLLEASPGNRYLAAEGVLHDREDDRTFSWDPASLRRAAWGGGLVAFEQLGGDGEGGAARYVAVGPSMEAQSEFEIPAGRQVEAWRLGDGVLLASSDGQLYIVDVASGDNVAFDRPGGAVRVLPSGEGFALIAGPSAEGAGELQTCRVLRYDWTAEVLSDVSIPCAGYPGMAGTGVHLSADGRWIAATTLALDCCELLAPPEARFPSLATVSVFDAATGEEQLRVMGAAFPYRQGDDPGVWLADGSALVLDTVLGRQLVSLEGQWLLPFPSPLAEGRLLPAPDDPDRFLSGMTGIADVELPAAAPPEFQEPVFTSSWGSASTEIRIHQPQGTRPAFAAVPSILPAIQLPPFDDTLTIRTVQVTVDTCVNVRAEPTTESDIVVCLPDEQVVEPVAVPVLGNLVEGECIEDDLDGRCVWVHVLTGDGEQGWAYADYLVWPGTPLALPEEASATEEDAEG